MADKEQLMMLKRNIWEWNEWRHHNPPTQIHLSEANLSSAHLSRANLSGADLSEANLTKAQLIEAQLIVAKLSRAKLRRAILSGADLSRANLSGADLGRAKLIEAKLIGTNLIGANLVGAKLTAADLSWTDLSWTDLSEAKLNGAKLIEAQLIGAKLTAADLSKADLSRANLNGADLRGGDLRGASLSGAKFKNTLFISKYQLNQLQERLTQEQLLGCVFVEEEEARKERARHKEQPTTRENAVVLRVGSGEWTPLDMSFLFYSMQYTLNRLQYISTTTESDIGTIRGFVLGEAYPSDGSDYLNVLSLSMRSPFEGAFGPLVENIGGKEAKKVLCGIAAALGILATASWSYNQICQGNEAKARAVLHESEARGRDAETDKTRLEIEKQKADIKDNNQTAVVKPTISQLAVSPTDAMLFQSLLQTSTVINPENRTVEEHKSELLFLAGRDIIPVFRMLQERGMKVSIEVRPRAAETAMKGEDN